MWKERDRTAALSDFLSTLFAHPITHKKIEKRKCDVPCGILSSVSLVKASQGKECKAGAPVIKQGRATSAFSRTAEVVRWRWTTQHTLKERLGPRRATTTAVHHRLLAKEQHTPKDANIQLEIQSRATRAARCGSAARPRTRAPPLLLAASSSLSPAWPCSPGGAPCPCVWGGTPCTRGGAGGTPTRARGARSGAHRSASSATAPPGTCRLPCLLALSREPESGSNPLDSGARRGQELRGGVLLFECAYPRKISPHSFYCVAVFVRCYGAASAVCGGQRVGGGERFLGWKGSTTEMVFSGGGTPISYSIQVSASQHRFEFGPPASWATGTAVEPIAPLLWRFDSCPGQTLLGTTTFSC